MFGKGKEKMNGKIWDWDNFKTTEGFPVSDNLLDWVVGQDFALEECQLCIDEWVHKLQTLKANEWWKSFEDPMGEKPPRRELPPPGPFLFMLGDPGTGKSLLGRAMATYMTEIYNARGIELTDVISWKNPTFPSEPKISIHGAGKGRNVVLSTFKKKRPSWIRRNLCKLAIGLLIGTGLFLAGLTILDIVKAINGYSLPMTGGGELIVSPMPFVDAILSHAPLLSISLGMIGIGVMVYIFSRIIGGNFTGSGYSIGGAESKETPKLIVDNSAKLAPFIDATGHGSAQLFGSIAWDPYQTGGLGTPEHQRVSAGDVHRAHQGILFIDEVKNLHPSEAITLLTVLEDGQLPIALRSQFHGGDTAAMAVSTEPVPCMTFFIAAGNFDSINKIHPALLDRIRGYGKVVRMNNEMPNTVANRRKYVQFIAQEINRFHLLPFTREACEEIVSEGRRRSGFNDKLTTKFRHLISIVKTASILALNDYEETDDVNKVEVMKYDGESEEWIKTPIMVDSENREIKSIVERKHVIEAIDEHCKTIQKQMLEYDVEVRKPFIYLFPDNEPTVGQIAGLSVSLWEEEMVGQVAILKASMIKCKEMTTTIKDTYPVVGKEEGYFIVTGAKKTDKSEWIHDSINKVRHVIQKKFNIDPAVDYKTMIDFQQEYSVDGPSAGITMTLALASIIKNRKIRQDVAVTGEITIDQTGKILITPIGGADAKIKAAEAMGYKKVVIPMKNFTHSIQPNDYGIKVVGAETLEEYMEEVFE